MRPAVVIAVLLSVYVLDTVTGTSLKEKCATHKRDNSRCEDGWSFVPENRCLRFENTPKNFKDAEAHCRTLGGHLVSQHSVFNVIDLLCLNVKYGENGVFWVGMRRGAHGFVNVDGSSSDLDMWNEGEPTNEGDCAEMSEAEFTKYPRAYWRAKDCSVPKNFVCSKRV